MSDELGKEKGTAKTLDERFANRPHTYWRLQEIADQMDQAISNGATADEAEAMAMGNFKNLEARCSPIGPKPNNRMR